MSSVTFDPSDQKTNSRDRGSRSFVRMQRSLKISGDGVGRIRQVLRPIVQAEYKNYITRQLTLSSIEQYPDLEIDIV